MSSCVFPGSFDPVTLGHTDLISRASRLFDNVYVAVMINIQKKGTIPADQRISMLKTVCRDYSNVIVERWDGLLADYMNEKNTALVIRGVRHFSEYEHELNAATVNKMLNSRIETVFLPADPKLSCISSSAVKEIYRFGGDIRPFVPEILLKEIISYLSK